MRHSQTCLLALLLAACGGALEQVRLPAPVSAPPQPATGVFRAGFARADLTPPPGLGLGGFSIEGQQATGYRHRLYARAMLLEDARGERVAIVVADLPQVSLLLHRKAAKILEKDEAVRIGADRLMLVATHSHAAPGHLFEAAQYNQKAGPLPGFDPAWVDSVVHRIARAVRLAAEDLAPARAAWGSARIPDVTVNRSMDAYRLNRRPASSDSVDDRLNMLRVDQCPSRTDRCRPRGAFSVFAIHATGYPPVNSLMDGDIPAIAERRVEHHIDQSNGEAPGFHTSAFHLFAGGAQGDVSPNHLPGTRSTEHLKFRPGRRPGGPHTPRAPEEWRMADQRREQSLQQAYHSVGMIGDVIGDSAIALFDRLATQLTDNMSVGRAFNTIHLRKEGLSDLVCDEPRAGTANFAGAEDGYTRLYGWKILDLIPTGFEEGGHAIKPEPENCHQAKSVAFGVFMQGAIVGQHGFPEYAQLAAVRIGNALVGFVPWEVTTEAGARITQAMLSQRPEGVDHAMIVSLSNGYFQYLTTPEEYEAQTYEGGSNIYGPNTAVFVKQEMTRLVESLNHPEPIAHVGEAIAYPGDTVHLMRHDIGPHPSEITRGVERMDCSGGRIIAQWIDLYPGAFHPSAAPVLQIRHGDRVVAWDDMRSVEVRAKGAKGRRGYLWEITWRADQTLTAEHKLVLLERQGMPEVVAACRGIP